MPGVRERNGVPEPEGVHAQRSDESVLWVAEGVVGPNPLADGGHDYLCEGVRIAQGVIGCVVKLERVPLRLVN